MTAKKISKCESSIYIWVLQVVIIVGLACLAVWASLSPKTPIFTISNMDLKPYQNESAAVARRSTSSLALNVTISNPNKVAGIFFDELNITIRCNNESVGSRSVSGFYLGNKSNIDLDHEIDLGVNNGLLCGKVDYLRVGLKTGVSYKIIWFKTTHRGLVFEDYLQIGPDGQTLGTREMKKLR